MSSNVRVQRICKYCGNSFEAKTTVTRYCSGRCNKRDYKAKKRRGNIAKSNTETNTKILQPIDLLKAKDYLSVNDACKLIGVSRMTLHRQIKNGKLKTSGIGRRIIIKRVDLDKMLQ